MKNRQALLLAAASIALFVPPAGAKTFPSHPVLLAQADTNDAVTAAEAAVEAARAKLQAAMASGQGVEEAKQELNAALAALAQAQAAAGMPPQGAEQGQQPPAATDQNPLPTTPPPPPPETTPAPPPSDQTVTPPADQTVTPPADQNGPPKGKHLKPGQNQNNANPAPPTTPPPPPPTTTPAPETTQPPAATQTIAPPPAAEQTAPATTPPPPPPPPPTTPAPTAGQGATPPAATGGQPPATTPAPGPTTTPAPEPAITLPPAPALAAPPPPPPPAATQSGNFNLQNFTTRPKFGAPPPNVPTTPPPVLPKSEDALQNGAVIQAPGGRVIIKDQGQVTVEHDDSGRFVRQGDKVNNAPSDNGTETTTVNRPDGTSIVTVRDRSGNIIQRYRKNTDGSVTVLIGADVQQPNVVGRIFGQKPQLPPPRPLPPPQLNLRLGPLQITIPQNQYIVDSSRADEQQLQQTLMAPPIERVERAYSLEEIERNGRLRDKVRRIDFDTITFDTGQATVPDDQIANMQTIGDAIRAIVTRDPSTVILIEGHTDAVGSDLANLALSDRRAETVAQILSYYYGIPPENLVTQGYGEQFLKVPTTAANRDNRRVAFRNITPLMRPQG